MKTPLKRILVTITIMLVALWLRIPAMRQLPYDIDERVYYPLAQRYAAALENGDFATLGNPFDNLEHPALAKLLYGVALALPSGAAPQNAPGFEDTSGVQPTGLQTARMVAMLASVVIAGLLAWYSPVAGLFFALSSWQIKYGVVTYLESVPSLLVTAAMLMLARWWRTTSNQSLTRQHWIQIGVIGGLVGMAAAAKYPYAIIAAPVMLGFMLTRWKQVRWRDVMLACATIMLGFYVFNPFMWQHPLGYIQQTVQFHLRYRQNALVQSQNFTPWYNLALLFKPMPYDPFFPFSLFNQLKIEGVLTMLGFVGLPFLWRRSPPLGAWLMVAILFLLAWGTKWAHYTALVIPPLALSGGVLVEMMVRWVLKRTKNIEHRT